MEQSIVPTRRRRDSHAWHDLPVYGISFDSLRTAGVHETATPCFMGSLNQIGGGHYVGGQQVVKFSVRVGHAGEMHNGVHALA